MLDYYTAYCLVVFVQVPGEHNHSNATVDTAVIITTHSHGPAQPRPTHISKYLEFLRTHGVNGGFITHGAS